MINDQQSKNKMTPKTKMTNDQKTKITNDTKNKNDK